MRNWQVLMSQLQSISTQSYISRIISRTAPFRLKEVTSQTLSAYTFRLSWVVSATSSIRSTYYIVTIELDKNAELVKRHFEFKVETI